jgi:uncharacterized protein (TIGR02271 family)
LKPQPIAEPAGSPATSGDGDHEIVVPVAVEELVTSTRKVEHERVRVVTHTEVREVDLDAVRAREDVHVERVAVGREISTTPEVRVEGDTTIIPVVEEVVVVEKRLVLREEIRITKRRVEQRERSRVTLRRERADVSRTPLPEASINRTK